MRKKQRRPAQAGAAFQAGPVRPCHSGRPRYQVPHKLHIRLRLHLQGRKICRVGGGNDLGGQCLPVLVEMGLPFLLSRISRSAKAVVKDHSGLLSAKRLRQNVLHDEQVVLIGLAMPRVARVAVAGREERHPFASRCLLLGTQL